MRDIFIFLILFWGFPFIAFAKSNPLSAEKTVSQYITAAQTPIQAPVAPVACPQSSTTINWTSKNNNDVLTINNGSSSKSIVVIYVHGADKSPGITLFNCGNLTHVNAGNSAICDAGDLQNPVSFSSDSANNAATGTYEIQFKG